MIRLALQAAGPAHYFHGTEFACAERHHWRSRHRWMLHVIMHVTRDEQIQAPVSVVIAERRTRGPIPQRHSGGLADVGERAVVIVAVQAILTEIRDVNIRPAVVIKITD